MKKIIIIILLPITLFSQNLPLIQADQSFIKKTHVTLNTQTIYLFNDYLSHDYEHLFTHNWQDSYDIHLSTALGHKLLFTDVNQNGVLDIIGNSNTINTFEVGVAEYDPNNIPIFKFSYNFPYINYWTEEVIDMNNDGQDEFLIGSYYPLVNIFNDSINLEKYFPIRAQWLNQTPSIKDIDQNNHVDFVIDQVIENNHTINFYEYNSVLDSLVLKTKLDSIMINYYTGSDTIDTLVAINNLSNGFGDFVAGDLDGDGNSEVACGHVDGYLNIFENENNNYTQVFYDKLPTYNMYPIAITNDIDNNGKNELIIIGDFDGCPIYWFESDSDNTYSLKRRAFIDPGPNSILGFEMQTYDVNSDGFDDLVCVGASRIWVLSWNRSTQEFDVYFYLNTNEYDQSLWGNIYERNFPGYERSADFFDIDDDGDQDMFISTDQDITLFFESNQFTSGLNDTKNKNIVKAFSLSQNFPNPFNPTTKIKYTLPTSESVKIEVFNLSGQIIETIINKSLPAGSYEINFNAKDLPSGVYLYRISAGGFKQVKKMLFIK